MAQRFNHATELLKDDNNPKKASDTYFKCLIFPGKPFSFNNNQYLLPKLSLLDGKELIKEYEITMKLLQQLSDNPQQIITEHLNFLIERHNEIIRRALILVNPIYFYFAFRSESVVQKAIDHGVNRGDLVNIRLWPLRRRNEAVDLLKRYNKEFSNLEGLLTNPTYKNEAKNIIKPDANKINSLKHETAYEGFSLETKKAEATAPRQAILARRVPPKIPEARTKPVIQKNQNTEIRNPPPIPARPTKTAQLTKAMSDATSSANVAKPAEAKSVEIKIPSEKKPVKPIAANTTQPQPKQDTIRKFTPPRATMNKPVAQQPEVKPNIAGKAKPSAANIGAQKVETKAATPKIESKQQPAAMSNIQDRIKQLIPKQGELPQKQNAPLRGNSILTELKIDREKHRQDLNRLLSSKPQMSKNNPGKERKDLGKNPVKEPGKVSGNEPGKNPPPIPPRKNR